MTPQAHTLYTVCLLYALNALLLWSVRRDRNVRRAESKGVGAKQVKSETPSLTEAA